ncbi:7793_t:CDS:2, partial [Gigaspora rosea]
KTRIRMLSEAFIEGCDIDFEIDKQSEFLKNYSLDSMFREFLQNADQAGARRISIYVDERQWHEQSTLLSKEMYNWQGPAIWIYNDAEFKKDFSSLGKSGIITSYYLTDVLTCVSGEAIVFLDSQAKFLPTLGNPPRRPQGIKLNFLNKRFLSHFEDQCKPYIDIEECNFQKCFNGTLFRLPLRSSELSKQSSISSTSERIQNLKEDVRNIRRKVDDEPQIFQLDTKIYYEQKKKTTFEVWLVCTGGRKSTNEFSKDAHGGVAAILARSDNEPLKKPLDLTDPPVLVGKNYVYVPCNDDFTKLNVHINGNFVLSKDRKVILRQNNTHERWNRYSLQQNNTHERWNRYILLEVLPPLHVKLLGGIAQINYDQYEHFKNSKNIQPNNFVSCITKTTKGFWPFGEVKQEADEGKFVSLDDAYFSEENDFTIANILAKHSISTVKVEKAILNQLKSRLEKSAKYQPINSAFVYKSLQANSNILKTVQDEPTSSHKNILVLLKFVLRDMTLYSQLIGLPLVPLKDGSFDKFGRRTYYIAKKKDQDLFPKSGPSHFICDLDDELSKIFESKDFLRITNIKKLDAQGILDLLAGELCKEQEIPWNPSSQNIPNRQWLDNILEKMEWGKGLEFTKLSEYPLLPVVSPNNKLVRADSLNPLLTYPDNSDEILVSALGKLGICFTDIKLDSKNANSEFLKKSVFSWSESNVFESIKRKLKSQKIPMESFFSNAALSEDELNKLRELVKATDISQQDNIEIIKELPIWPTRSEEYISAKEGKLLPHNLPCYSSDKDLFNVTDEYFSVLILLGAKQYKEFDYVKQYYYTPDSRRVPTQEDVEFLEKILLLNDPEIMDYLKNFKSIPNKSLKSFVKADTLYDAKVDLFSQIFDDNRFLPSQLQNNYYCFRALLKMGLKQDLNNNTYIECAREVEFKINIEDELNQLYKIKFVPSNKNLPNPYNETVGQAGRTSGYESFGSLYSIKYQNICWTQAKFFASDVKHVEQSPNVEMVIDH